MRLLDKLVVLPLDSNELSTCLLLEDYTIVTSISLNKEEVIG